MPLLHACTQVSALYSKVQQWDTVCAQLPQLLQHLKDLQHLHEQSAHVQARLEAMSQQQAALSSLVRESNARVDLLVSSVRRACVLPTVWLQHALAL